MICKELKKRCPRCENLYEIPKIKESPAFYKIIEYYPCCHCGYTKDVKDPKNNRSGRCSSCAVPFSMIDHHAKGRCNRCYVKYIRENATKIGDNIIM